MINEQISHLTSDRTDNQEKKFDEREWIETAGAIEKEFVRWTGNLTSDWAEKWEKRERMDEAAHAQFLNLQSHFSGACTAPTFSSTQITGPTGPAGPSKSK